MPGVEAGDIGPKLGYASKDNGYLIFTNVRIPRRNMVILCCRKFILFSWWDLWMLTNKVI